MFVKYYIALQHLLCIVSGNLDYLHYHMPQNPASSLNKVVGSFGYSASVKLFSALGLAARAALLMLSFCLRGRSALL
jgi:hypothetical protein